MTLVEILLLNVNEVLRTKSAVMVFIISMTMVMIMFLIALMMMMEMVMMMMAMMTSLFSCLLLIVIMRKMTMMKKIIGAKLMIMKVLKGYSIILYRMIMMSRRILINDDDSYIVSLNVKLLLLMVKMNHY